MRYQTASQRIFIIRSTQNLKPRVVETIVVGGPAANGLDSEIAKALKVKLVRTEHKIFPDGESYVRLPETVKGDVVVVQSLYPPQDKHLLELLIILDLVKDLGAGRVTAVVPYLAYARQDKRFKAGEAISVKTVLKCIEEAGADRLVTVDIHKEESLGFFKRPSYNTTVIPELTRYLEEKLGRVARDPSKCMILSPDKGGVNRVKMMAEMLGVEYDYVKKERDRETGEVRVVPKKLDVEGKIVVIVDDIISTGGTIALAARSVKELGAVDVYAMCSHALLIGEAFDKIVKSGVRDVVAANTVPSSVSKISASPAIIRGLKKLGVCLD